MIKWLWITILVSIPVEKLFSEMSNDFIVSLGVEVVPAVGLVRVRTLLRWPERRVVPVQGEGAGQHLRHDWVVNKQWGDGWKLLRTSLWEKEQCREIIGWFNDSQLQPLSGSPWVLWQSGSGRYPRDENPEAPSRTRPSPKPGCWKPWPQRPLRAPSAAPPKTGPLEESKTTWPLWINRMSSCYLGIPDWNQGASLSSASSRISSLETLEPGSASLWTKMSLISCMDAEPSVGGGVVPDELLQLASPDENPDEWPLPPNRLMTDGDSEDDDDECRTCGACKVQSPLP